MSLPTPTLSQEAQSLHLKWVAFDPVDLTFTVLDVDWSGAYTAQVRDAPNRDGRLLASLIVTATYVAPDTRFRLVLADSSPVPNGGYWDLQAAAGPTRLAGRVFVVQDVTT